MFVEYNRHMIEVRVDNKNRQNSPIADKNKVVEFDTQNRNWTQHETVTSVCQNIIKIIIFD